MTDRTTSPLQRLREAVQPTWARLAPRERLAVAAAASVVGLALLWWLGVAPALATLRQAGCAVEDLEIGRADLEDIFLAIMQGRLTPPPPGAPIRQGVSA